MPRDIMPPALIQSAYHENDGYQLEVSLEDQPAKGDLGINIKFEIDSFKKKVLLEGLDDISQTLQNEKYITTYENSLKKDRNWVFPAN